MANFPFNTTIPAANNDPSSDQPIMLSNNVSEAGIWDIDHIGFNSNDGGTHLQNTFVSYASTPGTQTGENCVVYPTAGAANPGSANIVQKNSSRSFLMTGMRAFCAISTDLATGVPTALQAWNCVSIAQVNPGVPDGRYTLTLIAGATTGTDYAVFVSSHISSGFSVGSIPGYLVLSATQISLNFRSLTSAVGVSPIFFSVLVFQA